MHRFFSITAVFTVAALLLATPVSEAQQRRFGRSPRSYYQPVETVVSKRESLGFTVLRVTRGFGYLFDTVPGNRVVIEVTVPTADAEIFFDEEKTKMTGTVREFRTPALSPGQTYTYTIKCTWKEDGQTVNKTKEVNVFTGQRVTVIFKPTTKKKEGADKAVKELQGEWQLVEVENHGGKVPAELFLAFCKGASFKGELITFNVGDGWSYSNITNSEFKVDPTKSPKTLEIELIDIDGKGKHETAVAIYSLEGGKLRWAWGPPGGMTPKTFSTKEGDDVSVLTFERKAKQADIR